MGTRHESVAIACSAGGFKGVFLHGVLAAFEEAGYVADGYGAASSSVLPAAAAAIGRTRHLGLGHWIEGLRTTQQGLGMSRLVLDGINRAAPTITRRLFRGESPRFVIAANAVDAVGTAETQGLKARRLGRRLLLAAARGDRGWVDEHLALTLFDSKSDSRGNRLSESNFAEVAYASSRMLHAWDVPAWIDGRAYVDAYYCCACPAYEIAGLGFSAVIALSNEPVLYRDIFKKESIRSEYEGIPITILRPDFDPQAKGVGYTMATDEGLAEVYEHGLDKGMAYLRHR